MSKNGKPARWWIGTVPHAVVDDISSRFDDTVKYAVGQLELGNETGYKHWQLCVNFCRPVRLTHCTKLFGSNSHWEPTRSSAACGYVVKSETAVDGTRFEYGKRPINRADSKDWDQILADAKSGRLDEIPSDVVVRYYNSLRRIATDHLRAVPVERRVLVFWGATGTGKSRRAWAEAGMESYPKDPRTKFWDGYMGQEHVVIDEYRGGIDISHLLRWFDRYPVVVEIKGSATTLKATTIWITSNLNPRMWYPDLDEETQKALMRRLIVTEFVEIKSG